ncbi:MAG: PH domain-containing protein [Acidobacteriota bacterium]
MGYAEKNLAPGESIVYRARYHWIFYRSALLVLLLAAILGASALYASKASPEAGVARPVLYLALGFAGIGVILLAARALRASNDEFVVTERRVMRSVGLLSREHEQAPIEKIQDITVTQSILGRLLDFGDVSLETASERGTLLFPAISAPEGLRSAIWTRTGNAAARPAAVSPAAIPGARSGTAERLEELEHLRRNGIVSEAEYAAKRRDILGRL